MLPTVSEASGPKRPSIVELVEQVQEIRARSGAAWKESVKDPWESLILALGMLASF